MGLLSGLGAVAGALNPVGLLGTVGAVGGPLAQYFSADQQNRTAQQMASDSMNFSASQTQQQMAFQERMSGTAHQREVADLRAAGLNPLLSANAGASSPAGGAATGVAAPVVPQIGPAVSSAMDSLRLLQDLKESNSRVMLNQQSARTGQREEWLKGVQTSVADQQAGILEKQNAMLKGEANVMREHPTLMGWMKALRDRGVDMHSAIGTGLSLFGE